jgi:hypothetical protein
MGMWCITVRRQARRELVERILAEPKIRKSLACIGKRNWAGQQLLQTVVITCINTQLDAVKDWAVGELGITRDDEYLGVLRKIGELVLTELVLAYLNELLDGRRWAGVLGIGRQEVAVWCYDDAQHIRSVRRLPPSHLPASGWWCALEP